MILKGVKVRVRYVVDRWHKWQNYSDKQLPYMKFIKTLTSEDLFGKKISIRILLSLPSSRRLCRIFDRSPIEHRDVLGITTV